MAAKFFGQFLLEKGLISSTQLLQALDRQRECNPLLGEIAERLGMLSADDARRINTRQRREDKRFGDLALEMGLLDAQQIDRLLAEQKAGRRFFGEILLDLGFIESAVLDRELALHRNEREDATRAVELVLSGHRHGDLANRAAGLGCSLFVRVLQLPCQVSTLLDASALAALPIAAQVRIEGDREFGIALACDEETMLAVGRGFLGSSVPEAMIDAELSRDALGEFLNIVMGYVVKDVLPVDARYRASPPNFSRTPSEIASGDADAIAIGLTSPAGDLALIVSG